MPLVDYVNAAFPERYDVLNIPLQPFSLGHYFLMKKHGCGFSSDDPEAEASFEDLLLAICICSRKQDEFEDFITSPEGVKWVRQWGKFVKKEVKKATIASKLRKLRTSIGNAPKGIQAILKPFEWVVMKLPYVKKLLNYPEYLLLEEVETFQRYMRKGARVPHFWNVETQGDSNGTGAHWSQSVLHILVSECNYTEAQALDMPLGKAFYNYCQWLAKNGLIEFFSEEDERLANANSRI